MVSHQRAVIFIGCRIPPNISETGYVGVYSYSSRDEYSEVEVNTIRSRRPRRSVQRRFHASAECTLCPNTASARQEMDVRITIQRGSRYYKSGGGGAKQLGKQEHLFNYRALMINFQIIKLILMHILYIYLILV